jgi:lysophospholipase L1-like esterase
MLRRAGGAAAPILVAVGLFLVLEGAVRVLGRMKEGAWPVTPETERYEAAGRLQDLVMEHPYLIGVPRPHGAATLQGKSATVNSHGYRGPEFQRPKPDGTVRVLAIGGSTTFDVCVTNDDETWTRHLERALRARFDGRSIEVVNGGAPGYTSLEMLVKLEIMDLEVVEPDVIVAFVGLNDLQPSAAPEFRADYSRGHAEIQRRFLGFETRRPGIVGSSVLLFKIRRRLGLLREEIPRTPRRDAPLPEAEATYRGRLEGLARIARDRAIPLVFVTQRIRFGGGRPMTHQDSLSAFRWLPYLTEPGIVGGLERYNAITREVAAAWGADLADVARDMAVGDADFADYCHWTDAGALKMGRFLAERLPAGPFEAAPASLSAR